MTRLNITALDHIVLNVTDIDRSLAFYTEVLGLAGERVAEFRAGQVGFPSVRINDATIIDLFHANENMPPALDAKQNGNLNHFCMVVDAASFAGIVDFLSPNFSPIEKIKAALRGIKVVSSISYAKGEERPLWKQSV